MPGGTLTHRLGVMRTQLDDLAQALARFDVDAIEASARALSDVLDGLPPGAMATSEGTNLPNAVVLDDLHWQLVRCRRLGSIATAWPGVSSPSPVYGADGTTAEAPAVERRLKVAG